MRGLTILLAASVTVLAGCPVPQDQNTPVPQRLFLDPATGQEFWLYVPSTYREDRPAPLIFTCHGSPPFDVADMHIREWKALGEQYGCIVVAPKLVGTDGIFGGGPLGDMLEDERRILSIVSLLGYRYNIDRANVMITGFSGGGFPTYFVGLRHPDVFTCVVARNCNFNRGNLDGWFPPGAVRTPVLVYWGEVDPLPIIVQSRRAVRYLQSRGFDVATDVVPGSGHERHPEYAMRFFLRHRGPAVASLPAPPAAGANTAARSRSKIKVWKLGGRDGNGERPGRECRFQ